MSRARTVRLAAFGTALLVALPARAKDACEEPPAAHGVYLELGGAAILYSANYEFRPDEHVALRIGASVLPVCLFGNCTAIPVVPVSVTGLIGDSSHHFEAGGGLTFLVLEDEVGPLIVPEIGYRYARREGGFLFRATFTPFLRPGGEPVLPWGGVSLGASF